MKIIIIAITGDDPTTTTKANTTDNTADNTTGAVPMIMVRVILFLERFSLCPGCSGEFFGECFAQFSDWATAAAAAAAGG